MLGQESASYGFFPRSQAQAWERTVVDRSAIETHNTASIKRHPNTSAKLPLRSGSCQPSQSESTTRSSKQELGNQLERELADGAAWEPAELRMALL